MSDQISHTYIGMHRHLEDGFGYHREILEQMTVNEIIEAFEKEMADLFNSVEKEKEVTTHFILKCKECDKTISQCRCPAKDKEVRYSICEDCKKKEEGKWKERKCQYHLNITDDTFEPMEE